MMPLDRLCVLIVVVVRLVTLASVSWRLEGNDCTGSARCRSYPSLGGVGERSIVDSFIHWVR